MIHTDNTKPNYEKKPKDSPTSHHLILLAAVDFYSQAYPKNNSYSVSAQRIPTVAQIDDEPDKSLSSLPKNQKTHRLPLIYTAETMLNLEDVVKNPLTTVIPTRLLTNNPQLG
jgi:hypothetical protein